MEKKIKILYMINGLGSGGTERQVVELLANMDRESVGPVLVYYRLDEYFKDDLAKKGIKIMYVPKRRRDKFLIWRTFVFISKIRKIIIENNIDLIHSYGVGSNFWARLIGRLSGKKVIISIRSTKLEDKYDLIEKILEIFNISSWYILENLFHHLAAKIIVNSSGVKEAYMKNVKKCQAQKIEVIHNGFNFEKINYLDNKNKEDIRNAYGLPADKAVFICVGRIREQKNQLCLLKAAKILADQGFKDFKILFVGKKYIYYDILEKYIAKNRLSDISEFYGERKDVLSLIKASDLFILSSLWEGLANVVIESMAVGTPVLAAKIKGVEDLIAENETGFTFMVNNEKDLAEKILNIIKIDNITLGKVASQARENIRNNFSIEKLVQKTIYVYRNCLDNE